jgi:hypothetical protein
VRPISDWEKGVGVELVSYAKLSTSRLVTSSLFMSSEKGETVTFAKKSVIEPHQA